MTRLSMIAIVKFLRERGWPFAVALDTARAMSTLQAEGRLPPGGATLDPPAGGSPVTVRELERAGGVTRVEFVAVL